MKSKFRDLEREQTSRSERQRRSLYQPGATLHVYGFPLATRAESPIRIFFLLPEIHVGRFVISLGSKLPSEHHIEKPRPVYSLDPRHLDICRSRRP